MAVITLCGSTRFKAAFEEWNVRLTLLGNVVLSIVIPSHAYGLTWNEQEKAVLDAAHLRKIDLSDEIFVLDIDGYIGQSTSNEIAYAHTHRKRISYLSKVSPPWDESQYRYAPSPTSTLG